jgi:hypothetical protein
MTAQIFTLDWREPSTTVWTNNNVSICGESRLSDLKISYQNDPNCPYSGLGANRYRYTRKLYKDGTLLSTRVFNASSCWFNDTYLNSTLTSGTYTAHVTVEVRKFWWSWRVVRSGYTNSIVVSRNPSVPSFKINGITPDPKTPIEVCPGKITLDASGTTCESKYFVGVWEFDYVNWNRPQEYEWGRWFDGEAPTDLNLQQLSSQYSYGTDFLGNNPNRQGDILFSGTLPNNTPRYYHISVCTGNPAWECASAVIKVKCSCL